MKPPRVAVLLGAGASADAGLPLTNALAARLVDEANEPRRRMTSGEVAATLNRVYGAMVGYEGGRGGNPRAAVNIERLISAVRLLANRDEHEVAPFVTAWSASAGELSADTRASFERLEDWLLQGIRISLGATKSVNYLLPLGELARHQAGGLDILTLNYDLTVEEMAIKAGIRVDTGVARWRPSFPLVFRSEPRQINLYKLHGSINWKVERRPTAPGPDLLGGVKLGGIGNTRADWHAFGLPWIVIGDREKLATDGPTLEILTSATAALRKARRLVVVGYSFGDLHVNQLIRDWLLGDARRQLTVLDPAWAANSGDIRSDLASQLGRQLQGAKGGKPRLNVIELSAKEGLQRALDEAPRKYDPFLTVKLEDRPKGLDLIVENHGADIRTLNVQVFGGPLRGILTDSATEAEKLGNEPARLRARRHDYSVPPGHSTRLSFKPEVTEAVDVFGVHVDGTTVFEHFEYYFNVPITSRNSIRSTDRPGWDYSDGIG